MNLANKITFVRLLLVPVYIILFLYTDYQWLTLIVFAIASFTDFLDGFVARKYNMITDLGKFLDPLVDKILTLSPFILFTYDHWLHPVVTILVVSREIVVSVFRALAASKNMVIAANMWGKVKTVLQILTILVIHLYAIYNKTNDLPLNILIGIMCAVTLLSGYKYVMDNKKVL